MRVTLLQLDLVWEDPAANLTRISAACEAHPPAPGELLVLPELATTGFSVASARALAESVDGPSVRGLQELAKRWHCRFMAGIGLLDPHGISRNSSVLIDERGIQCRYDKLQPFSPPGEAEAYPAGEEMHPNLRGRIPPEPVYLLRPPFP